MRIRIFVLSFVLFMFAAAADGLSLWENASIALFIYFFFDFLENLGKRIVMMDLAVIMAALT